MSESFQIYLTLKVFLEEYGEFNHLTEIIYFSRNIELPYIPQIGSEIKCSLHPNDYGQRPFKVRYVTTYLDKNYQLTEETHVITEDTYTLKKFLHDWNVDSIEELGKRCTDNGWFVILDDEILK